MTDQEAPLSFRANEEDRKILASLQKRLGLKMSQVLKVAIRRLLEMEQQRHK